MRNALPSFCCPCLQVTDYTEYRVELLSVARYLQKYVTLHHGIVHRRLPLVASRVELRMMILIRSFRHFSVNVFVGAYKWGASPARHFEESNHMLKQDEILVLPSLGTRTEVTTFAKENEGRQYNPERAILCRHVVFLGEIWLDTSCCCIGFRNKRIPSSILVVAFLKSYYPLR